MAPPITEAADIQFQLTTHLSTRRNKRLRWLGKLVDCPIAEGLPTSMVTRLLQVERSTGKVRRPKTDVQPLCHSTVANRPSVLQNCQRNLNL